MKKISKIFATSIMLLFLCATATSAYVNNDETKETNEIILELSFQEPQIEKITTKGETYDRITIQGLQNTYDYKTPCLPVKPLKILLPPGHSVKNIEVFTSSKNSLGENYKVEVGGRLVPLISTQQEIEEQSPIISQETSQDFSNSLFSNVGVYNYRGFPILHVNLHPVEYNLDTGGLFYYKNMRVVVETEETTVNKALRSLSQDYTLVENIVDNPHEISNYKSNSINKMTSNDNYDYIIITNNKLKNSDEEYTLQDLMDYKRSKGLNPLLVTVGEIILNPDYKVNGKWGDNNPDNPFYTHEINGDTSTFDDKAARIRNFIRYAYSELGAEYVLLAGDADGYDDSDNIIPARGLFADEDGLPLSGSMAYETDDIPSDVYYACLDGNFNYDGDSHFGECAEFNDEAEIDEADLYAEVWVGRACADSTQEISNFVEKTIAYEETTNDPYISEILFIGEELGSLFYTNWGGEYKDQVEGYVPPQYNLEKMYDQIYQFEYGRNWYPEELFELLNNDPPHIINHDGHGHVHYGLRFGIDGAAELTNDKYFFLYSHSCLTGSFDNGYDDHYYEDDCLAEYFTVETNHGAFAVIMNARYGLGSEDTIESPSGLYDESFYKALFTEDIKDLGHASHYSKEEYVNRIDENGMRWCYYQTNLFGDPSLRIKDPADIPPNKPDTPAGPSSGKRNTEYTYTTSAIDPNSNQLYYLFDWGDGTNSGWVGPYASDEEATAKHSWSSQGNFEIKAKAKNTKEVESEWSDPLSVSMPKNKGYINTPLLLRILENHPHIFPILQQIIKLFRLQN